MSRRGRDRRPGGRRGGTKPVVVLLAGILVALVVLIGVLMFRGGGRPGPSGTTGLAAEPVLRNDDVVLKQKLADDLVSAGWPHAAANAVVTLNTRWFCRLRDDQPEELKRQRVMLQQLGQFPQVFDVLEHRPEIAGLLAQSDDPTAVADSLRDDGHYDLLSSLYLRHIAPEDAQALARAWDRHGDLIARLTQRGLTGAELVFMGGEEEPGDREYGSWLEVYFKESLTRPDEELAADVGLVLIQGPTLRHRLEDDAEFRRTFLEDLWPSYARVIVEAHLGPETFVWAPEIWDLLRLTHGEALLRRWGLLAIALLFGPQGAYPKDLHPELIQMLLHGDNAKIRALYRFRGEPLLHHILRRHGLSESTRLAFLDRLDRFPAEGPETLKRFDQYGDRAFAEELGPPVSGPVTWIPLYYTVYEVPKKVLQGRPVSMMEFLQAVADPAFFLLPGAKGAEKAAGEALKTTLVGRARQLAIKQLGVQPAKKLTEKELAPWLLTEILAQIQRPMAAALAKHSTLEITGPVRFLYGTSGVGRASFRRLTDLEARLFMRGDARVFIRLDRALAGTVAGRFLNETAQAAGIGATVESPFGQNAVQNVISNIRENSKELLEASESWKEHVSAWWLMNATEMLGRTGTTGAASPIAP